MKNNRNSRKVPEEKDRDRKEDLRAENRRLRKQVQQLRKEAERAKHREDSLQEFMEEFESENKHMEKETAIICPKCKSKDVKVLPKLRDDVDYYICQECGSRGKLG